MRWVFKASDVHDEDHIRGSAVASEGGEVACARLAQHGTAVACDEDALTTEGCAAVDAQGTRPSLALGLGLIGYVVQSVVFFLSSVTLGILLMNARCSPQTDSETPLVNQTTPGDVVILDKDTKEDGVGCEGV